MTHRPAAGRSNRRMNTPSTLRKVTNKQVHLCGSCSRPHGYPLHRSGVVCRPALPPAVLRARARVRRDKRIPLLELAK